MTTQNQIPAPSRASEGHKAMPVVCRELFNRPGDFALFEVTPHGQNRFDNKDGTFTEARAKAIVSALTDKAALTAENAALRAALESIKNTLSVVLESRELDSTVRSHREIRNCRDSARSVLDSLEGAR